MRLKWEDYKDRYFSINLTSTTEKSEKLIPVHTHLSEILKLIPKESEYIIGVTNRSRNPETF